MNRNEMRRNGRYSILVVLLLSIPLNLFSGVPVPVRVMSFNIRLDTPADGENAWRHRINMVVSMIRFHDADLVGIQEGLANQVRDLSESLRGYDYTGVGRDDGMEAGEFCAIYFKKDRFKILDSGTFWLSPEPGTPGPGWDAACNRIVTWALFLDLKSRKEFYCFNTHFDHVGQTARKESANLIIDRISSMHGGRATILTGDFNSTDRSEVYGILTHRENSLQFTDSYRSSRQAPHGPESTWSGFRSAGATGNRIDFIFVSAGITVLQHGHLSEAWGTRFPSDHLPVLSVVLIE